MNEIADCPMADVQQDVINLRLEFVGAPSYEINIKVSTATPTPHPPFLPTLHLSQATTPLARRSACWVS